MEFEQVEDQLFVGPEGKPSKVTDYKLYFPGDFQQIARPELFFTVDKNYIQPSFKVTSGQVTSNMEMLRKAKQQDPGQEHGILGVNDRINFYQTKTLLTGESGIGFKVIPQMPINDYFHTHYIREGEDEKVVDLFSPGDLWSMGSKGAERYWLVGKQVVWCLVNLYGQRYYYQVKDASLELAKKYDPNKSYEQRLGELIEAVNKCEYRLYRGDTPVEYQLVN